MMSDKIKSHSINLSEPRVKEVNDIRGAQGKAVISIIINQPHAHIQLKSGEGHSSDQGPRPVPAFVEEEHDHDDDDDGDDDDEKYRPNARLRPRTEVECGAGFKPRELRRSVIMQSR